MGYGMKVGEGDRQQTQRCSLGVPGLPRPGPAPLLSFRIKHFGRHSQLQLVNSTGADTGEYSCQARHCLDGACAEGEARQAKTFIFFTGALESGLQERQSK